MIQVCDEGVMLEVRAYPGSRVNQIKGEHQGRLQVAVTAAPEKGKANKALCKYLAKALGIRPRQVSLVAGDTHTHKRFLITDVAEAELLTKLEELLAPRKNE